MPLSMLSAGHKRIIVSLRGKEQTKKRLEAMGFIEGETVEVLQDLPSGLVVLVKGVRVALNRGLAISIMVSDEPIPSNA